MTEQLVVQSDYTDDSLSRPIHAGTLEAPTPVERDGSFSTPWGLDVAPRNPAGDACVRYLSMDKGLLLDAQGEQLAAVHRELTVSPAPFHRTAAGWAAVELAVMSSKRDTIERLRLFDEGVSNWLLAADMYHEQEVLGVRDTTNSSNAIRQKLNIIIAPLLRSVIQGECTPEVRHCVLLDCLELAEENNQYVRDARAQGNEVLMRDHAGFSVENLALIGYNLSFRTRRFAIPSSLRAGDGSFSREETHDLLLVDRFDKVIRHATPAEVKTTIRLQHVERYRALLIGGKRDLSIENQPIGKVFDDLGAVARGVASSGQRAVGRQLGKTIQRMSYAYQNRRRISPRGSVTEFHKPIEPPKTRR